MSKKIDNEQAEALLKSLGHEEEAEGVEANKSKAYYRTSEDEVLKVCLLSDSITLLKAGGDYVGGRVQDLVDIEGVEFAKEIAAIDRQFAWKASLAVLTHAYISWINGCLQQAREEILLTIQVAGPAVEIADLAEALAEETGNLDFEGFVIRNLTKAITG